MKIKTTIVIYNKEYPAEILVCGEEYRISDPLNQMYSIGIKVLNVNGKNYGNYCLFSEIPDLSLVVSSVGYLKGLLGENPEKYILEEGVIPTNIPIFNYKL